ncbi:MAG TPA: outer membrane beta-barrel protein [Usitatibacteraceae bacterium]
MKKTILGLSLLAALASTQAMAQDGTWYVSGAVGQSECKNDVCDVPGVDKKSTSVAGAVGYNFTKIFALEAGYFDMGKAKYSDNLGNHLDIKAQGPQLSLIVTAPIADAFSIYGRLGVARTDRKLSGCLPSFGVGCGSDTDKKTETFYGVGVGYSFTKNLMGTLEYQKLDNTDVTSFNAGVRFTF